MTFTAEALNKAHGPAARRKAIATMKRNKRMKAKAKGVTSMIDVASLPRRPRSIARKGHRRIFTAKQRARIVAKISAAVASGKQVQAASRAAGIHPTQYRDWKKARHLLTNGNALNGAGVDDDTVRIALKIGANSFDISIDEAVSIHAGLAQLLQRRAGD